MQHAISVPCTQLLTAAARYLTGHPVAWLQLLTGSRCQQRDKVANATCTRAPVQPLLAGTSGDTSLGETWHVSQHARPCMIGVFCCVVYSPPQCSSNLAKLVGASQCYSSRAMATAAAAKRTADVQLSPTSSRKPTASDNSHPAPTPSPPPRMTISTEQLQDWVTSPTRAMWAHFCSVLLQQVPARVHYLDYELNSILRELSTSTGLPQLSLAQPAAGSAAGRPARNTWARGDMVKPVEERGASKSNSHVEDGQNTYTHTNNSSSNGHSSEELVENLRTKLDEACWRLHSAVHAFLRHSHHSHPQRAQHTPLGEPVTEAQGSNSSRREIGEGQQLSIAEATDDLKKDLELESEWMIGAMRSLAETPGWWDDPKRVAALNNVMKTHQTFVLSMRVLLSEALCCWARLRRTSGLKGMGFRSGPDTGGDRLVDPRWSMAGPQHPPGWEEEQAQREPPSLIHTSAPLVHLLQLASEDARALCIEKNGIAPEVAISGDADLTLKCLDSYVEHVYLELLKNTLQALIKRWGAWNVDEAQPVQVQVEELHETDHIARLSEPNWVPAPENLEADAIQHTATSMQDGDDGQQAPVEPAAGADNRLVAASDARNDVSFTASDVRGDEKNGGLGQKDDSGGQDNGGTLQDGSRGQGHGSTAEDIGIRGMSTSTAAARGPAGGSVCIMIVDEGAGMSREQLLRSMDWFSTTHNVTRGLTGYGYSRDHGSQMQGMGVGMPLSVVYAQFMGGHVMWQSEKDKGTKVKLFLPRSGLFEF